MTISKNIDISNLYRIHIKCFLYFGMLSTLIFFLSCSDEDDYLNDNDLKIRRINLSSQITNNTTHSKIAGSDFSTNDKIGVYVVDYINSIPGIIGQYNNAVNIQHTYNGSEWNTLPGEELFWTDTDINADIFAYYPYDGEMSKADNKKNLYAYPYSVSTDQSINYTDNDFLWAKATNIYPTEDKIDMLFSHSLSKITVNLISRPEIPEQALSSLLIHNLKNNSFIDMTSGTAVVTGNAATITPYREFDDNNPVTYKATYHAIVIPQIIEAGTPLFTLEIGGHRYIYEIDNPIEFLPQKEYHFNIRLVNVAVKTNIHKLSLEREELW